MEEEPPKRKRKQVETGEDEEEAQNSKAAVKMPTNDGNNKPSVLPLKKRKRNNELNGDEDLEKALIDDTINKNHVRFVCLKI